MTILNCHINTSTYGGVSQMGWALYVGLMSISSFGPTLFYRAIQDTKIPQLVQWH